MIGNRKNLVLYHGTLDRFAYPRLGINHGRKDFGPGFYCTTDKVQAISFTKSRARRAKTHTGCVNMYRVEDLTGLKVLEFTDADTEWLGFICTCRRANRLWHNYDVVIGKIADDDTALTLQNYLEGMFRNAPQLAGVSPEQFTIGLLRPEVLKNRVCLCTPAVISRLQYLGSMPVRC